MGKIKVLSSHEAQRIAAGEVVERPANIVKELLENALDAGATNITVHIENGGKDLIRISDNGYGMSPEDADMCIEHHATSKLTSVNELESLATFGFRGEALSSIASVAHITITTKEEGALTGTKLVVEGSKILAKEEVSCTTGTTFEVRNLFYNLPARHKFLKKEETEWRAIYAVITAACLAYHTCSFTIFNNDKQVLQCPVAKTLKDRCSVVFDTKLTSQLLDCHTKDEKNDIHIQGVISRPTYSRYDRNYLYFFVNNRWVKNSKLGHAIIKGYTHILPPKRYPAACLFITLPSTEIDVNVHPRKEEISFLHPRRIEQIIEKMVKNTLENTLGTDLGFVNKTAHAPSTHTLSTLSSHTQKHPSYIHDHAPMKYDTTSYQSSPSSTSASYNRPDTTPATSATPPASRPADTSHNEDTATFIQKPVHQEESPYRLVGQLLKTYLLVEKEDAFLLVDQHAAHERVIYEQLTSHFENIAITNLLFPQLITLDKNDAQTLLDHLHLFQDNGILLETFSATQFRVTALPTYLKNASIQEMIRAAIGWLHEEESLNTEQFKESIQYKLRAMMACKAAIKAGDTLDETQMHQLLRQLYATPNNTTCPHGRPTWWHMSQTEIERIFKRCG